MPVENAPDLFPDWPKVGDSDPDVDEYECKRCNSTDIRKNPIDQREWGCNNCGVLTHSVSLYFRSI